MMNCEKVRPLLSEYIDACLSEEDNLLVKEHLLECPECAKRFKLMQSLMASLRDEEIDVPEGLVPSIMDKIQKPVRRRGFLGFRPFTAAAIVVLLAFVAWQGLHNGALFNRENRMFSTSDSTQQESIASDKSEKSASVTAKSVQDVTYGASFAESVPTENAQAVNEGTKVGFQSVAPEAAEGVMKAKIADDATSGQTNRGNFITYSDEVPQIPFDRPFAFFAVIETKETDAADFLRGLESLGQGYYFATDTQWAQVLEKSEQTQYKITIYNLTGDLNNGVLLILGQ